MYMHLSSVRKYSFLLKSWGVSQTSAALTPLPRPTLYSHDHSERVKATMSGFLSQNHPKLIFHFIYSFKHALALHVS